MNTNDARNTHEKKQHSTIRRLFSLVKCYIWSLALYGAETWTLRKVDQKYLQSLEMWCWRRLEKISWADCVRNEEVLQTVEEENNILQIKEGRPIELVTSCVGTAFKNMLLKET
jgi:hypothetical protein